MGRKTRGRTAFGVRRGVPFLLLGVVLTTLVSPAAGGVTSGNSIPFSSSGVSVPGRPVADPGGLDTRSQPLDNRSYNRPVTRGDATARTALPAGYALRDTIVSNTDPNLTNTDTQSDSEPYLAINGGNANEIVIDGFNSSWNSGNGALLRSTDGGSNWTKVFTVPRPTGTPATGCPCDQVYDFDRSQRLLGTILDEVSNSGDVYTGSTSNAGSAASWLWRASAGVAQKTDNPGGNDVDQPWLRVTRSPTNSSQDFAYVAYDDFSASQLKVGVSNAANPPNFTTTSTIGAVTNFVNPGTRLAPNHANGTMYAVYQFATAMNADGSVHVLYGLNRSTDGGVTWSLNGSSTGIAFVQADSNQPSPKFGTVNALLGGVDSVNVDPTTGDVYIVYGIKDANTGNNRLAIVRLVSNGTGGLKVSSNNFMTGQVTAALPSVAVADNGTIGVLYDTFDGFNGSGFPVFSAHLAQSTNHGVGFSDVTLQTFTSPAKDNGDPRQRVLGDYQALRVLGNNFYGTFTANGASFGRPFNNTDAIFIKAPAASPK